jgi:hypothetical protein
VVGSLHPQVQRIVTATDQFGENDWNVFAAVYLLVPAWKNESAPGTEPPTWNHYLCYEANGPLVNVPVTLVDQFGSITTTVMEGKYFCNPVEKTVEGQVYPMIDPQAHLTCYMIDDDNVYDIDVTATDQFGWWQLNVNDSYCLCTPAWKGDVVRAEASTWGKIKALYQ